MNIYSSTQTRLDFRTAFAVPFGQFMPWLVAVAFITYFGYPGVICITPMAWLIALQVGNQVVYRSRSTERAKRQIEAGLAGGVLGLLQGILFAVVTPIMGPVNNDEQANAAVLILIILIVGVIAGAGLAWVTAYLSENRRAKA
jgi:hypothetical protein